MSPFLSIFLPHGSMDHSQDFLLLLGVGQHRSKDRSHFYFIFLLLGVTVLGNLVLRCIFLLDPFSFQMREGGHFAASSPLHMLF